MDVLEPVLVIAEGLLHLGVSHLAGSHVLHVVLDYPVQSLHLLQQQVVLAHLLSVGFLVFSELSVLSLELTDSELELFALLDLVGVFFFEDLFVAIEKGVASGEGV